MKSIFTAIIASTILVLPAFAQNQGGNNQGGNNNNQGGHHGAPGPVAGAGLPVLAVGFGVYWLIRRRRKPN
jgi:MYXO-CTERM domain-containing protein